MRDLIVDIDGERVRLDACSWVLWRPDGWPLATSVATNDSPERAMRAMCRMSEIDPVQAERDGWRVELMTTARWSREVMPIALGDRSIQPLSKEM